MQGRIVEEFTAAAHWLAELTVLVKPDDWDRPGLGSWSVRSLVGHTARALVTVEEYLELPADRVDTSTAMEYLVLASRADPAAIAARGVSAGEALAETPGATVAKLAALVPDLVSKTAPGTLLTTIAGGMRLDAYLPTRTVELIVHGCDLARAVGVLADPPTEAAASVVHLLADVSMATRGPATVCLSLAGRPVAESDLVVWPSLRHGAAPEH